MAGPLVFCENGEGKQSNRDGGKNYYRWLVGFLLLLLDFAAVNQQRTPIDGEEMDKRGGM